MNEWMELLMVYQFVYLLLHRYLVSVPQFWYLCCDRVRCLFMRLGLVIYLCTEAKNSCRIVLDRSAGTRTQLMFVYVLYQWFEVSICVCVCVLLAVLFVSIIPGVWLSLFIHVPRKSFDIL